LAFRVLTVDVTRVIHGQVGKQISVLEDGGVVPYAAVKDYLGSKVGAPSGPARADGYVDFRFMGARHSEVGDDVLLFPFARGGDAEDAPAGFVKSADLGTITSEISAGGR
jgi:hypothetical protein